MICNKLYNMFFLPARVLKYNYITFCLDNILIKLSKIKKRRGDFNARKQKTIHKMYKTAYD